MSPLPATSTAADTFEGLTCRLSPHGRISLRSAALPAASPFTASPFTASPFTASPFTASPFTASQRSASAGRIAAAFDLGTGQGLLHLGAVELDTDLPPGLAYWRRLGGSFVRAACGAIDSTKPATIVLPAADPDFLAQLAVVAPPMLGAELVSPELLGTLWDQLGEALTQQAAQDARGVQGYLEACHSVWHVAGRVCLHLAENKRDPDCPFAFIATYARQRPGRTEVQHVPLSRALQEYAGARKRDQLLALLTPLQRAAEHSELIRDLVDSGDIYHPLAWTSQEAYALLCEAPVLEKSGLVVRLPDWWKRKRRRRPSVSVTVGDQRPSALGLASLLDFNVQLTLGGARLTAAEVQQLLSANAGLVLIKGEWVEVDPDKLASVLAHFEDLQAQAAEGGVSFGDAMRLLAGADLSANPADAAALDDSDTRPDWSEVVAGQWLNAQLDALRSPVVSQAIADNAGLNAQLRPYQKVGVQWLWTLCALGLGGCLADDMGLGKTIQVIGLLSLLHAQRVNAQEVHAQEPAVDLLVVPASLVDNWSAELARFSPQLRVLIAHPSRLPSRKLRALSVDDVTAHQVVITTYGTVLRTPWIQDRAWRTVVLDEAQAIKNPGAKQTRAVKKLSARWRLALTGTPVENRLGDLWSIFDFLSPGLLGSARTFGRFSKAMAQHPGDGYAPLRGLVSPYIMRRLKTDRSIIADLPDKTEVKAHCLLTRPQAALYTQAVADLKRLLDDADGMKRRGAVLAALMRFKQICNHPSQWLGDGDFNPDDSGKFLRLAQLCEPIRQRQDKLLVFTQFRVMTQPLQRHLSECFGRSGLVLHGGTPVKKRSGLVARFQEDDDIPFMVLSIKAGGTGLNLTAANHVIHFDRWWNPAVENQATDRAYRIGQHNNVLVHKFVCMGTVEERIDQLITGKQQLSDQVLAGGAEIKLTELSNAELLALVSLDMNKAVMP